MSAPEKRPSRLGKWLRRLALAFVVVLAGIQLVPYGRDHSNPPERVEPEWDSPRTRELAVRACFDCHSNETRWPWYSHVAPISWLVQYDVDAGREELNFSDWDNTDKGADDGAEEVEDGEMPPWWYILPMHPEADLTAAEKKELIEGLRATEENY